MNDVAEIYNSALRIIDARGQMYGGIELNFHRAAAIASLKLDKTITTYDVAVILESVKDARRATDPGLADSHVDGLNYKAFAMMFAPIPVASEPETKKRVSPKGVPPVKRGPGRPRKTK